CSYFVFFFSSRRRHTRFSRDWSSDVCSSDLGGTRPARQHLAAQCGDEARQIEVDVLARVVDLARLQELGDEHRPLLTARLVNAQIGRASCRERAEVCGYVGAA